MVIPSVMVTFARAGRGSGRRDKPRRRRCGPLPDAAASDAACAHLPARALSRNGTLGAAAACACKAVSPAPPSAANFSGNGGQHPRDARAAARAGTSPCRHRAAALFKRPRLWSARTAGAAGIEA